MSGRGQENLAAAAAERERVIVRTSAVGIAANVLLAAFKAVIGLLSNSIAVMLDAVNNLSDALSSVITIIGTKLAGRKPNKKHPLGHGRIEYLTAMLVAALVLYAGITSLVESVKKILWPETPDYSTVSLVVLLAAVVVKLVLGSYVKRTGERVNSGSLIASGSDARFDAILSSSVLAAAVIYLLFQISLEAYVGVIISGFIIKSGVEMMRDTLSDIIGRRADPEFAEAVRRTVCEDPEVLGAFDLYLYNYGPNRNYGSIHVEVEDTMTADEIDAMDRRIQAAVYLKHGVILTGIGLYSVNTQGGAADEMRRRVMELAMAHEYSMQFHGFYVDFDAKRMTFDVVLSFDCEPADAVREITEEVRAAYPDFEVCVQPDVDVNLN